MCSLLYHQALFYVKALSETNLNELVEVNLRASVAVEGGEGNNFK